MPEMSTPLASALADLLAEAAVGQQVPARAANTLAAVEEIEHAIRRFHYSLNDLPPDLAVPLCVASILVRAQEGFHRARARARGERV